MGAHYCKVCGEYCAGGNYTIDKDGNDLCNMHGQELLEKLEAEVERLREFRKSIDTAFCGPLKWLIENIMAAREQLQKTEAGGGGNE